MAKMSGFVSALAEAYEPAARADSYPNQLRALRVYVITWNDRWNGLFETYMAGGNLAGREPAFPVGFLASVNAQ